MNSDFELSNLINLESVYIGAGSFYDLKSFSLSHNPKLKIFETGDGYEEDDKVKECTFSNVNQFELSGNFLKTIDILNRSSFSYNIEIWSWIIL